MRFFKWIAKKIHKGSISEALETMSNPQVFDPDSYTWTIDPRRTKGTRKKKFRPVRKKRDRIYGGKLEGRLLGRDIEDLKIRLGV